MSASPAPYVESRRRAPPVVVEVVEAVGREVVKEKHWGTQDTDVFRVPCLSLSGYWCLCLGPFLAKCGSIVVVATRSDCTNNQ